MIRNLLSIALLAGLTSAGNAQIAKPVDATTLKVVAQKGVEVVGPITKYDFGTIDLLDKPRLDHTFTVRNEGSQPLTIESFQASCSCATIALTDGKPATDLQIAPGQGVTIRATLDPTRLHPGHLQKYLWAMLHGSTVAAANLELDADVRANVVFEPAVLAFGQVSSHTRRVMHVHAVLDARLIQAGNAPKLACSRPDIVITPLAAQTTSLDGKSAAAFDYTVRLAPHPNLGALIGSIGYAAPATASPSIATALEAAWLPLSGEIVGSISASPGTIIFGAITGGQTKTLRVTIAGASAHALQGLKVTTDRWLSAHLQPNRSPSPSGSSTATLTVTLDSHAPPGSLNENITLTTATGEHLILPVMGVVGNSRPH